MSQFRLVGGSNKAMLARIALKRYGPDAALVTDT
jgi:hypothetical protein